MAGPSGNGNSALTLKTATRTDLIQAAISVVLEQHRIELDRNAFMEDMRIELKFKNGTLHPVRVRIVPDATHYLKFEDYEPIFDEK